MADLRRCLPASPHIIVPTGIHTRDGSWALPKASLAAFVHYDASSMSIVTALAKRRQPQQTRKPLNPTATDSRRDSHR